MMNMIKPLIVLSLATLLLAGCGYHHAKHKMMNEGMGTLMQKKLDLSPEQVKEIDALTAGKMVAFHQRSMQLMVDLTGLDSNSADYVEKYQQLAREAGQKMEADIIDFAQTRAKVLALLNEQQVQKLTEMREKMLAHHAKHKTD